MNYLTVSLADWIILDEYESSTYKGLFAIMYQSARIVAPNLARA